MYSGVRAVRNCVFGNGSLRARKTRKSALSQCPVLPKKSYAVKQACTSGGLGVRKTPISKHTARMVNGGEQTHCSHGEWRGFKKTHIMRGEFQKRLIGCQASLHKWGVGRGGAPPPPPFANTPLAW